jgi:hypothetical protein
MRLNKLLKSLKSALFTCFSKDVRIFAPYDEYALRRYSTATVLLTIDCGANGDEPLIAWTDFIKHRPILIRRQLDRPHLWQQHPDLGEW